MPSLDAADALQSRPIYDESFDLWGGGLSRREYRAYWDEMAATEWAREHMTHYVWSDPGEGPYSAFKLYRPRALLDGATTRVSVFGAVYTLRRYRGHGHAARMLEAAVGQATARGDEPALLFSDIGGRYYEKLGFTALPAEESSGRLRFAPRRRPAGWTLRPIGPADLDPLVAAHEAACRRRPFALLRDGSHWRYLLRRARRFFERLGDRSVRQRIRVARYRGRFVGYLITVEGRGEWCVREVGSVAGEADPMAEIVRCGAAEARAAGLERLSGWLPPEVSDRLGDLRVTTRRRRHALPMIRSLRGAHLDHLVGRETYIPFQDQF